MSHHFHAANEGGNPLRPRPLLEHFIAKSSALLLTLLLVLCSFSAASAGSYALQVDPVTMQSRTGGLFTGTSADPGYTPTTNPYYSFGDNYGGSWSVDSLKSKVVGSGTIHSVWVWQPDGGNSMADPPPAKVLVYQSSAVAAVLQEYDQDDGSGITVTASNGLGATSTPIHMFDADWFQVAEATSEKYTVKAGGATVTVDCTPSTEASTTDNEYCEADGYVTYKDSVTPLRIGFNGAIGKLGNQRCLVGMGVTAQLSISDSYTVVTWNSPSGGTMPFKSYDTTAASNQLTLLDSTFSTVPHFFNAKNDIATVTCSGTTHGESFTVTENLKVERPLNILFTANAGEVKKPEGQGRYGAFSKTGDSSRPGGMNWLAMMSMPSGYSDGTTTFTQKITMTRDDYYKSGQPVAHRVNQYHGQAGLDRSFDFFGIGSSVSNHSNDSPEQGYDSTMSRSESADSFVSWLMFKPAGTDSAWVPLRKHTWSWGAKVDWNNSSSDFDLTITTAPTDAMPTDAYDHPTWTLVSPSPQAMVSAP